MRKQENSLLKGKGSVRAGEGILVRPRSWFDAALKGNAGKKILKLLGKENGTDETEIQKKNEFHITFFQG